MSEAEALGTEVKRLKGVGVKDTQPKPAHIAFMDTIGRRVAGRNEWRVQLPHSEVVVRHVGMSSKPWRVMAAAFDAWTEDASGATPVKALTRYFDANSVRATKAVDDMQSLGRLLIAMTVRP